MAPVQARLFFKLLLMKRTIGFLSLILVIALVNGGGCNLFSEMSGKGSDEAIIDDVNNLMDKGLWNDAVLKWQLLTPDTKSTRAAKLLLASAYAGRGGLNLINLIISLTNNSTGGSKTLFELLMTSFTGSRYINVEDQISAQNQIFSISSSATSRTVDENIFLVFVEFAKIGTILATYADTDGDKVLDPTFDNCSYAKLPRAYSAELVVAIAAIIKSIDAAGSTIAQQSLSTVTSACQNAIFVATGFCDTVDVNAVTQFQIDAARTLIGENNLGLGLKVLPGGVKKREFTGAAAGAPGDSVTNCPAAGTTPCLCP